MPHIRFSFSIEVLQRPRRDGTTEQEAHPTETLHNFFKLCRRSPPYRYCKSSVKLRNSGKILCIPDCPCRAVGTVGSPQEEVGWFASGKIAPTAYRARKNYNVFEMWKMFVVFYLTCASSLCQMPSSSFRSTMKSRFCSNASASDIPCKWGAAISSVIGNLQQKCVAK